MSLEILAERSLWPWALVVALLALLLFSRWQLHRARRRASRASSHRNRRAQRAEREALSLVEAQGFQVIERQPRRSWTLSVDGQPHEVECRADLLLEKDAELWVGEVKSGDQAPEPTFPSTRRQLLEYLLAFRATGVLVVDMERRALREVGFDDLFDGG